MKNQLIAALVAVLVVILGVQIYRAFRLNDKLDNLGQQKSQAVNPPKKIPKPPNLAFPKPGMDDKSLEDHPWNPEEELQRMQNQMDRIFSDSFSRFHPNTPSGGMSKTPEVDLQEKSDRYIVTVNAPGADESSLEVKLEGQQLHISIHTEQARDQTDESNGQYDYHERFMGEFHRVLSLPGPADAAKMTTDYHNGVLTISIPKA